MQLNRFQSPLHRGRVFNHSYPHDSTTLRLDLSVPSSSGKGLQLFLSQLLGGHSSPFSPLFIGEGSSTGNRPASAVAFVPFSPLFIGEGSSTRKGEETRPEWRTDFQSPLHRGRVFNRISAVALDVTQALSVPSSSGKGLQHKYVVLRGTGLLLFQSPLHRGRVFNFSSSFRSQK